VAVASKQVASMKLLTSEFVQACAMLLHLRRQGGVHHQPRVAGKGECCNPAAHPAVLYLRWQIVSNHLVIVWYACACVS
jgi:hypothetical protein